MDVNGQLPGQKKSTVNRLAKDCRKMSFFLIFFPEFQSLFKRHS